MKIIKSKSLFYRFCSLILQLWHFRQVVSFEKEVIRVTNVINDTNFEIPYGEIKKLRKKKYLLIFQTKDQHIIILDKLQMSIAQQDELLRIIHKKMPWLRARGLA